MGRYAEFNTMFSYKFAFAKQSSNDITLFGGECFSIRDDEGKGWWSWNQADIPIIKAKLATLDPSKPLPDLLAYEKSAAGTDELLGSLWSSENYAYVLGLLIYHQLTYSQNLLAEFEF
jgi:hypothetical protein